VARPHGRPSPCHHLGHPMTRGAAPSWVHPVGDRRAGAGAGSERAAGGARGRRLVPRWRGPAHVRSDPTRAHEPNCSRARDGPPRMTRGPRGGAAGCAGFSARARLGGEERAWVRPTWRVWASRGHYSNIVLEIGTSLVLMFKKKKLCHGVVSTTPRWRLVVGCGVRCLLIGACSTLSLFFFCIV